MQVWLIKVFQSKSTPKSGHSSFNNLIMGTMPNSWWAKDDSPLHVMD